MKTLMILALAIQTMTPMMHGGNTYDVPLDREVQRYIHELADEHDIPVGLIYAIIETESSFRPNVISGTNDYGLMQINVYNHEWLQATLGVTDFLDPYQNIQCGVHILAEQWNRTGRDFHKTLMAYNYGYGGASKHWRKGTYQSSYSRKVMERYEETYKRAERLSRGKSQPYLLVY